MQFSKINKTSFVAGVGSAVLLGAALAPGLVGAQATDATPATTAEASVDGNDCGPRLGGIGVHVSEDLAAALGVTVEELQAAAESVRETFADTEHPATEEARDALHAELQAAFAAALGISVDDLEAAKAALQAEHQAEAIARVNEKVAEGRLTQEQADAIIERIESRERPLLDGWPRRGGFGGRDFGGFGRFGRFGAAGASDTTPVVTPDA